MFRHQLTKYERAQVIGLRAEQLARGAQPMVDVIPADGGDVCEIARRELDARRLPFMVVRRLPDGTSQTVRLTALPDAGGGTAAQQG